MKIEAGTHQIWPGFDLQIASELHFTSGLTHLQGPNGAGKSSFLTQLLLPRLVKNPAYYCLYFEQQMQLQITAVKAYAALMKLRVQVESEADAVDFLLQDLLRSYEAEPRPSLVLMDESLHAERIKAFLDKKIPDYSLVFSSHGELFPSARSVVFKPLSPSRSLVDAPAN